MRVIRAAHLGMCFGVRDAIALATSQAETGPVTVLGELVHNPVVLAELRAKGIAVAATPAEVRTRVAMVTAHGASDRALAQAAALGLEVVEATCPLVHVAHRAVRTLVHDGYHPIVIGLRDHVEVRGLVDDLVEFDVVLTEDDVRALRPRPRLGIAAQTTQPLARVLHLVALIRARFPDSRVRFMDTVCQPTKKRQHAAVDLAGASDVVIVVGGTNSNNTQELVRACREHCERVHHVQSEAELCEAWFSGAATVGLTAGTSTPDIVIDRVEARILALHGAMSGSAA